VSHALRFPADAVLSQAAHTVGTLPAVGSLGSCRPGSDGGDQTGLGAVRDEAACAIDDLAFRAGDLTARVQKHPVTAQLARGADRPDEGRLHFDRRVDLPVLEGRMHGSGRQPSRLIPNTPSSLLPTMVRKRAPSVRSSWARGPLAAVVAAYPPGKSALGRREPDELSEDYDQEQHRREIEGSVRDELDAVAHETAPAGHPEHELNPLMVLVSARSATSATSLGRELQLRGD
jgi:hypothetical protein